VNLIEQNDYVNKVTIIRKGEAAKKFNAVKTFYDYFSWNLKIKSKKLAIEEQSKKKYDEKYKDVRQDK
jgi:peptidylprolyl isomerase